MKISKYLHSCIVLEKAGMRILFDPGSYCFLDGTVSPADFENISALFVTHNHLDHCQPDAIRMICENNPGMQIFTNPMTAQLLEGEGIAAEAFHEGEKTIGSFSVRAIPAVHEKILMASPQNTAYFVDGAFLHPGDSFDPSMHRLQPAVLAFPTWAPWLTHVAALEFAVKVSPKIAFPIHDWPVKDAFVNRQNQMFEKLLGENGISYRPLGLGEAIEI